MQLDRRYVQAHVWSEEKIMLPLSLVDNNNGRKDTNLVRFIIINASSPYDMIFRGMKMNKFWAIASTMHDMVNFHTKMGVRMILTKKRTKIYGASQNKNNMNGGLGNPTSLEEHRTPTFKTNK